MDTDLISRSALIDSLGASDRDIYCREIIEDAPAVDAVPVGALPDCHPPLQSDGLPAGVCGQANGNCIRKSVDFFCKDGERKETDNG